MIEKAVEALTDLLQGKIPEKIDTLNITEEAEYRFATLLNQLFMFVEEIHEFIAPLSQGELSGIKLPRARNFLGSPFKELHSHLLHLTWQAKQVASGDYSQRVDFMGEFSESFNHMIVALENNEKALKLKIAQLEGALSHISQLEGILPICMHCKKIRLEEVRPDKPESWITLEGYISNKTDTQFSHGVCPECLEKYYPETDD